ncbi:hypothetical protein A5791_14080 [Mycobacterium sp. 852002-51163_SCH5372311]|nr:hypothetical protein A5791_14080 [Mycobacterium sp. 852002-51163_SCH5372311]
MTPVAKPDVIENVEPIVVEDVASQAPVLITEQEVVFSTAVALSPRPASKSRRLFDAIRAAGAALRLPPPKQHLPQSNRYLEHARMAREMERL